MQDNVRIFKLFKVIEIYCIIAKQGSKITNWTLKLQCDKNAIPDEPGAQSQ